MRFSHVIFMFIAAVAIYALNLSNVFASPIDCSHAKNLTECSSVCDDFYPPEIDFTPPFSKYVKRYNDCLKKAYKTFKFPQYWFSDYPLTDRYRSMFLKDMIMPAVSLSKMSSCEGQNIPAPVLAEQWKYGMIVKIVGVSGNRWIDMNLPSSPGYPLLDMGTVNGSNVQYYHELIVEDDNVRYEPMNIAETPVLKSLSLKNGEPFKLSFDVMENLQDSGLSELPVPSEDNYVVSPYGQVLWTGFKRELTDEAFELPSTIIFNPGHREMQLSGFARYEYNNTGLPSKVSTYRFNGDAQSFGEDIQMCTSFDGYGRMIRIDSCCDNGTECDYAFSLIYHQEQNCPQQIVDQDGKSLAKFEYGSNHRLHHIYSADDFESSEYAVSLYYTNNADYNWPVKSLKYRYEKPLSSVPDMTKLSLDNMRLFNPNMTHQLDDHFARPFWMDNKPVTQGEFEKLMGRNPSHFRMNPKFEQCHDADLYSSKGTEKYSSANLPVESVTWYDALAYSNARSRAEGLEECYKLEQCDTQDGWFVCKNVVFKGLDCKGYRLPTWEETRISVDNHRADIIGRPAAQNCVKIKAGCYGTFPVDTAKRDNQYLFDRRGNVYEWVWDWYGPYDGYIWGNSERSYRKNANIYNSLGPTTGLCRRISGSSFYSTGISHVNDLKCYPPNRGGIQLGFRLVRSVISR